MLIQPLEANLNGSLVCVQLLDARELHNGRADVAQALAREVRAGNVLHEGGEVDARVLLGVAIRSYYRKSASIWKFGKRGYTYVVSG